MQEVRYKWGALLVKVPKKQLIPSVQELSWNKPCLTKTYGRWQLLSSNILQLLIMIMIVHKSFLIEMEMYRGAFRTIIRRGVQSPTWKNTVPPK